MSPLASRSRRDERRVASRVPAWKPCLGRLGVLLEVVEGATLTLENSFVNDLFIYPNPTKDELNISSIDSLQDAIYTIFDINGRRIMNSRLSQNTIDVSALNTGNYILRIVSGNSIKSQKFIKQ